MRRSQGFGEEESAAVAMAKWRGAVRRCSRLAFGGELRSQRGGSGRGLEACIERTLEREREREGFQGIFFFG